MYLIEAYVTNASLNVNRPFTYYSDVEVDVFTRIKVRFAHSFTSAFVVKCEAYEYSLEKLQREYPYQIQKIIDVLDEEPILNDEQFELAMWLSKTTLSPFISCLNALLPKALKTIKETKDPKQIQIIKKIKKDQVLTKRQSEVYDLLIDGSEVKDARKISLSIVNKFIEKGIIEIIVEEASFIDQEEIEESSFKELTYDQFKAYESILETEKLVSLIFGVTGSGKTEVYLHLARHFLQMGKDVLILVPEIALTPQMIARVKERFKEVVFYHSDLSPQEKYEQYKRVKNRETRIVVGTRSSAFLPFSDLGLIIVDEEHDASYKQDNTPTYHVKNVVIKRAMKHHAKVVFASATPSLESYTRALKGDYNFVKLLNRINEIPQDIQVIDLQKEIKTKGHYIISNTLKEAMQKALDDKHQIIILLNRRGYTPIIRCSKCHETLMCEDCDIPLNYHHDEGILKCHHCGRIYPMINTCPNCHEKSLLRFGFGTERVQEECERLFKGAKVERFDRDTTAKKGAHKQILERFENQEIDILIGTQMIAKGLDYPNVKLVGILNADAGLMHQDYNAAKVTFDLLMQASGRSGRKDLKGEVYIQAYNPDHYVLKAVLDQNYEYFYNIEMNYRLKGDYPPYSHFVALYLQDTNLERLERSVEYLSIQLKDLPYQIYRPFALGKIKGMQRYRILLKDKNLISLLNDVSKVVQNYINAKNVSNLKVDVDPLYIE